MDFATAQGALERWSIQREQDVLARRWRWSLVTAVLIEMFGRLAWPRVDER